MANDLVIAIHLVMVSDAQLIRPSQYLSHRGSTLVKRIQADLYRMVLNSMATPYLYEEMEYNRTETCALSTFHYSYNDLIFGLKSFKEVPDEGSSSFDNLLETKWQDAMNKGLFRFSYDPSMPSKHLPGKFGFFLEVNGQRHSTRRPPPAFSSTRQPFDPSRFHFGRAPEAERLFRLSGPEDCGVDPKDRGTDSEDHRTDLEDHRTDLEDRGTDSEDQRPGTDEPDDWVVINVSPIGRSHVLLVPRLALLLPQRLDRRGLQMMLHCLLLSRDNGLRGMFNSLGALASVNHYHLHLYRLHQPLYIETAAVRRISEELYEFTDYPARAFVFEVNSDNYTTIASRVVALTELILDQGLAFNLVATRGWPCASQPTQPDLYPALRVMVWPRQPELPQRPRQHFQLASCELAGHVAVTSAEALDILTEESIVEALRAVTQPAFDQIRPLITGNYLPEASQRHHAV